MFGVYLMKLFHYDSPWFFYAFLIVLGIFLICLLLHFAFRKNKIFNYLFSKKLLLIVIVISVALGSSLYLIAQSLYEVDFRPNEDTYYGISGTINTNYIQTSNGTYFFISNVSVYDESEIINLERNMYVYISNVDGAPPSDSELEKILPGNQILFTSHITLTLVFDYDEIDDFAYRNNFQHTAYVSIENIVVLDGKMSFLDSVREYIRQMYHEHMSDRYAGLAFSVLIGDRAELAFDIEDNFSISGIAHVVAVSGLNTTFIMMLLLWILNRFRINRWVKLVIVGLVLLFYALLCDMTPSIVRASLMSVFLLIGTLFGKQADKLNSISLAGIVTLLFAPLYIFDLSFLLSYAGVFGIFLLYPVMQKVFKWLKYKKLIDAVALTVSATIGTAPLIANTFGYFSVVGLLANLVLVPLFGYAFMILFLVTIVALIIPYVAYTFTVVQYGFWLVDKGAWLCASVPFASITLPSTRDFALIGYYVGIFCVSRYYLVSSKTKFISVTLCFLIYFSGIVSSYYILYNSLLI